MHTSASSSTARYGLHPYLLTPLARLSPRHFAPLALLLLTEVYFSMDDIADAAKAGDQAAAKVAWNRGKEYLNGYLKIVNYPIASKVGDKFPYVTAEI